MTRRRCTRTHFPRIPTGVRTVMRHGLSGLRRERKAYAYSITIYTYAWKCIMLCGVRTARLISCIDATLPLQVAIPYRPPRTTALSLTSTLHSPRFRPRQLAPRDRRPTSRRCARSLPRRPRCTAAGFTSRTPVRGPHANVSITILYNARSERVVPRSRSAIYWSAPTCASGSVPLAIPPPFPWSPSRPPSSHPSCAP